MDDVSVLLNLLLGRFRVRARVHLHVYTYTRECGTAPGRTFYLAGFEASMAIKFILLVKCVVYFGLPARAHSVIAGGESARARPVHARGKLIAPFFAANKAKR